MDLITEFSSKRWVYLILVFWGWGWGVSKVVKYIEIICCHFH